MQSYQPHCVTKTTGILQFPLLAPPALTFLLVPDVKAIVKEASSLYSLRGSRTAIVVMCPSQSKESYKAWPAVFSCYSFIFKTFFSSSDDDSTCLVAVQGQKAAISCYIDFTLSIVPEDNLKNAKKSVKMLSLLSYQDNGVRGLFHTKFICAIAKRWGQPR